MERQITRHDPAKPAASAGRQPHQHIVDKHRSGYPSYSLMPRLCKQNALQPVGNSQYVSNPNLINLPMKISVLLLTALFTGCTSTYLIRGEGGTTCATVNKQVQSSDQARAVYTAWLAGYLTRYNYERDAKLSEDFSADTLMDAATQYCSGKPLDDFSQATESVIRELERKN